MQRTTDHIQLRDFMGWRCSSCDRLITGIEDGWVEWLASEGEDDKAVLVGIRLVHRGAGRKQSCRYNPRNEKGVQRGYQNVPFNTLAGFIGITATLFLAERVGFEPTLEFPLNTLSKRAPSATRPSLR